MGKWLAAEEAAENERVGAEYVRAHHGEAPPIEDLDLPPLAPADRDDPRRPSADSRPLGDWSVSRPASAAETAAAGAATFLGAIGTILELEATHPTGR